MRKAKNKVGDLKNNRAMPTKNKMYKKIVYFDELSNQAKEKARQWWKDGQDYPFLEEELKTFITEELEKQGFSIDGTDLRYSLGYSQGDGVSFAGTITKGKKKWTATISRALNYVHAEMMDVENENGETDDKMTEKMRAIARQAEKIGYGYIEDEDKDGNVDDNIKANEYTFTLEGERMDADNL
jgi:hypothetical protein